MIAHPQNTSQIGTYTHIHIHSTPYLGSKKKKVWKPKAAVFFCVFFATSRGEKYRLVGRKLLIIHAHMYNQMSSLPPCSVRGCVRLPFLSSPSAITKKSTKKKKKGREEKKNSLHGKGTTKEEVALLVTPPSRFRVCIRLQKQILSPKTSYRKQKKKVASETKAKKKKLCTVPLV